MIGAGPSRGLVEKAAGVISAFYPARGGSWSRVLGREVLSAVWPALVEEAREGVRDEHERHERIKRENERLRDLYENLADNRERFGWTINHLLECEEALRAAQEELGQGMAEHERGGLRPDFAARVVTRCRPAIRRAVGAGTPRSYDRADEMASAIYNAVLAELDEETEHEREPSTGREPGSSDSPHESDPTAGLPDDLVRLLKDQSLIVPQHAAVFEAIGKWANAPSNTASASPSEAQHERGGGS